MGSLAEICKNCNGTGIVKIDTDLSYPTYHQCKECCGFGTLLVKEGDDDETD